MTKKMFVLYLLLLSPAFPSDKKTLLLNLDEENKTLRIASFPLQREETAEEIIAECQGNPEFMSCAEWLYKEHPDFSQEQVSSHPLFPLLNEVMALADFEVDTLEGFIHKYMETNMTNEQAEIILNLRQTAMNAKHLVTKLIKMLLNKTTIEQLTTEYFRGRFQALIEYQAELTGRKTTITDMSQIEKSVSVSQTNDPNYKLLRDGFLRSYNIKNKIMRDLLYYLRDQHSAPLINFLPKDLVDFIKLSPSLHPFLNKENEEWIDYDIALHMGEVRNFLGNATNLGIKIKNFIKEGRLKKLSIPKTCKKLEGHPLPVFLLQEKKKNDIQQTKASSKKKKKQEKSLEENVIFSIENKGMRAENLSQEVVKGESPSGNSLAIKLPEIVVEEKLTKEDRQISIPTSNKVEDKEISPSTLVETQEHIPPLETFLAEQLAAKTKPSLSSMSEVPLKEAENKVGNKHAKIIQDIFSPTGYANLKDDDIIAAWNHVLGDKGYHKENTGRSHQPLYASLDNGSQVVLGLFRSSGYGPRYVKYIQKAFDKIGFGKDWLKKQGYDID